MNTYNGQRQPPGRVSTDWGLGGPTLRPRRWCLAILNVFRRAKSDTSPPPKGESDAPRLILMVVPGVDASTLAVRSARI